jgi:glucose 1-dehydrogenase
MRNLVLKNQVVFGTVNAGRDAYERAIADLSVFAARWPGAARRFITGRYPIADAPGVLVGAPDGIKSVIAVA